MNSIGISILLGIIDIAEKSGALVVFSDVKSETVQLFEMLGLTRHVVLAKNEQEALSSLAAPPRKPRRRVTSGKKLSADYTDYTDSKDIESVQHDAEL